MALPTIQASDFTGRLKISADTFVSVELTALIGQLYPKMAREILGDAAYVEIREAVTLPEKWADVMNGSEWIDEIGLLRINSGLTAICRQWLYFYWQRESGLMSTNTGIVGNLNENSRVATRGDVSSVASDRYNEGVDMLEDELYCFLRYFNEVSRSVSSAANLAGNTWRLTLPDTLYLADGDLIRIDGIDYTAGSVTATTVEIQSTAVSFSTVVWFPFENIPMPRKERVFA